jgi:hypothetical protein
MSWQQYNWNITVLLNFSYLFKHFHIYVNFLEDVFESFVHSPRHRTND